MAEKHNEPPMAEAEGLAVTVGMMMKGGNPPIFNGR
jgi:hypothetical protein